MAGATGKMLVRIVGLLALAALLEVGGDAGMRRGIEGQKIGFAVGAVLLIAYGIVVNKANFGMEFGKLMGAYIAVFFLTSQLLALAIFKERLTPPIVVGGAFIVLGGCILTFWRPA